MYAKKKSVSMKVVVLLLAVVLLIGCVAGGTLAWLITSTGPVENTFVAGNIGTLGLTESDEDKQFTIVPGVNITKDPVVTFNGNNVPAYLFVKVSHDGWTQSNDGKTFTIGSGDKEMTWTIADGWNWLESGVYYRTVVADTDTQAASYAIIKDNTITVESGITKTDLAEGSSYTKSLTFTAYAIQQEGHAGENEAAKAAAAWAALQPSNP